MLINAFLRGDDTQRKELTRWVTAADPDPDEKVAAVTQLYNEIGIDKLAIAKIESFFDASKQYLDAVHVDESRKAELRAYAEAMLHRKF